MQNDYKELIYINTLHVMEVRVVVGSDGCVTCVCVSGCMCAFVALCNKCKCDVISARVCLGGSICSRDPCKFPRLRSGKKHHWDPSSCKNCTSYRIIRANPMDSSDTYSHRYSHQLHRSLP